MPERSGTAAMKIITLMRNIVTRLRSCSKRNRYDTENCSIAEHPRENRIDVLEMIAKIEFVIDLRR
jgi:hypothetical protein